MIPSVSMWSLDRSIQSEGLTQSDFLHWAKENNFQYVELVSYYMDQENNLPEILSLMDELKLQVSCYTVLTDFSVARASDGQGFSRDLETATALKAPFMRILTGGKDSGNSDEKENITREIKKAAEKAGAKKITLLLESTCPYTGHSSEANELMKSVDSPWLQFNFDTANPLLADETPEDALKALLESVKYVHFKDFITEKSDSFTKVMDGDQTRKQLSRNGVAMTGITAGKGEIPLKEMITFLKENGYKGFISQEYEGTGNSKLDTAESLKYLNSLL